MWLKRNTEHADARVEILEDLPCIINVIRIVEGKVQSDNPSAG
jgi:hypothetical protein